MKITNEHINLRNNGVEKRFSLHRLIMYAFSVPNPDRKPTIDHINSNYKDNRLSNLRWASFVEQMNNENTLKKISYTIEVTFPDGTLERIIGIKNVALKLKTSNSAIANYLSKGKSFNGYTLKKIDVME